MKIFKIVRPALSVLAAGLVLTSCQKMEKPALTDYPIDTNPAGGPLKFYAALDGSSVDSIRAVFGVNHDVTYVDGVSGQAVQSDVSKKGFVSFPSVSDFGNATDFTISFWIKATQAQKNTSNATGILAVGNSKNFWGNATFFAETEKGTSDSMTLKMHFNAAGNKDNWQKQYVDNSRWPSMYDGNWHQIAVTYHAADSFFTAYRDGALFDTATMNPAIKFENPSQLVVSGYQQAAGVVGSYDDSGNSWMAAFGGQVDQVRLYGTTLSASDVAALYSGKQ